MIGFVNLISFRKIIASSAGIPPENVSGDMVIEQMLAIITNQHNRIVALEKKAAEGNVVNINSKRK